MSARCQRAAWSPTAIPDDPRTGGANQAASPRYEWTSVRMIRRPSVPPGCSSLDPPPPSEAAPLPERDGLARYPASGAPARRPRRPCKRHKRLGLAIRAAPWEGYAASQCRVMNHAKMIAAGKRELFFSLCKHHVCPAALFRFLIILVCLYMEQNEFSCLAKCPKPLHIASAE